MTQIIIINTISLALTALLFLQAKTVTSISSSDSIPVPGDKSQVSKWFSNLVKPYNERKNTLDPALVTAEQNVTVIKVKKGGGADFTEVTDAIKSIPAGNTRRVIIYISGGVYNEKIKIERTKPFVTLFGNPNNMPNLTYAGTAAKYGTVDSATLIVESEYFVAANIVIVNSAPAPDGKMKGAQAVAMRMSAGKAAFYKCKFIGFQDTLCDDRGMHFFKDCYIQGTVDFIFGSGRSLYLNTHLHVLGTYGFTVITAQAREDNDETGYSFVHSRISGTKKNDTYLGRAWKSHPRVVYAYTDMGDNINRLGWSNNFHKEHEKTSFYVEYKCTGPGSATTGRIKYIKQLNDKAVLPFISLGYVEGSTWLLPPPNPKV